MPNPNPSPHISRLTVYPVKSCGGVDLQEAVLTETGLDLDRAWMVVDENREFVSQREYPQMALIKPQMKQFEVILRAPGMLALHLDIERVEQPMRVTVWDDTVNAFDMGDTAAQWMSMAITQGRAKLRLVRFDPEHQRLAAMKWTGGVAAPTQFSDGFPLLICTQASIDALNKRLQLAGAAPVDIDRFRANIVLDGLPAHDEDQVQTFAVGNDVSLKPVKPCIRCSVPDVNPQDASTGNAIAATLAQYRGDARMAGAVTFGMNAIVLKGDGQTLRVGDGITADYGF